MKWDEIMKMDDPHEALKEIEKKIDAENLSIQEMEDRVAQYAKLHKIEVEEMAYYPNGESVLGG